MEGDGCGQDASRHGQEYEIVFNDYNKNRDVMMWRLCFLLSITPSQTLSIDYNLGNQRFNRTAIREFLKRIILSNG